MSGSMSGMWKRGTVWIMRHRQTKGPDTDRPDLNNRATSRLYSLPRVGKSASAMCALSQTTPLGSFVRRRIRLELGCRLSHSQAYAYGYLPGDRPRFEEQSH